MSFFYIIFKVCVSCESIFFLVAAKVPTIMINDTVSIAKNPNDVAAGVQQQEKDVSGGVTVSFEKPMMNLDHLDDCEQNFTQLESRVTQLSVETGTKPSPECSELEENCSASKPEDKFVDQNKQSANCAESINYKSTVDEFSSNNVNMYLRQEESEISSSDQESDSFSKDEPFQKVHRPILEKLKKFYFLDVFEFDDPGIITSFANFEDEENVMKFMSYELTANIGEQDYQFDIKRCYNEEPNEGHHHVGISKSVCEKLDSIEWVKNYYLEENVVRIFAACDIELVKDLMKKRMSSITGVSLNNIILTNGRSELI